MPTRRAPRMSESTLSPTMAAVSAVTPMRESASSKSGGSGLPTTIGRTPAAAATASTTAPQPGRKSPPSSGQARVEVGREEVSARGDGAGGGGETLVGEARVAPDHDHLGLAISVGGHQRVAADSARVLASCSSADGEHPGRAPSAR